MTQHAIVYIGKQFGKLTVLDRIENGPHGDLQFNAVCDCGKEVIIQARQLNTGKEDCGCVPKKRDRKYVAGKGQKSKVYLIHTIIDNYLKTYRSHHAHLSNDPWNGTLPESRYCELPAQWFQMEIRLHKMSGENGSS
jgi:hypothetical protein